MAKRTLAILFMFALTAPALALPVPLATSVLDAQPALDVRIDRDEYGVPHVYADDAYSLFWGNGYAQAEDRLFQMDALRHVGKGDSAFYLGPSQLAMDLATRRELYTDQERSDRFDALAVWEKEMFQAFADGVNAYILETRLNPLKLSAEFYALGHEPEDWVAEDTIAIAEFLLDIFGAGSGGNELENAQMLVHLIDELGIVGAEKAFNDMFWMHDASTYTTIDASEYTYPTTEGPIAFADIPALQWDVIHAAAGATPFAGGKSLQEAAMEIGFPVKFGSNAMVVSAALSENGSPLLLGGPQMSYYNPMIPYEVGLHGAGFDAVGMGVGGAPGVIIGRATHYAWTVTSGSSDQVDVVAERLVAGNPRQYYDGDDIVDMDCRTETHFGPPTAIDQNPPVLAVQEVCRTLRGPVFAMNEEAGYAFVRERTHRLDELRSGILWLTLGRSANLAAFQAHMQDFCFEFNFHFADDAGNIAYDHWGCNPIRASGYDPRLPRVAGAWDWVGVLSGSDLPHITNPAKGYIVNWNNKPAQGWSSGDAAEKWGPVNRAELIEASIATKLGDGKLSIEELKEVNIEISTRSPFPAEFVPTLLTVAGTSADTTVQAAGAALADWAAVGFDWRADDATCKVARGADPCFGTHPAGFTIYEAWRGKLQGAFYADDFGPNGGQFIRQLEFRPQASSDPHAADHGREDNKDNVIVNALAGKTAHDWCDDRTTVAVESCEDLFASVLTSTVADLATTYGSDVSTWRQPMHTIKFSGLSGGPTWNIAMVNRPSFPHYYDWGTGEAGSVLPPGTDQSWAPVDFMRFSADGTLPDAHKRDQLDLYVDFAWKPANITPAVLESSRTFS